MNPQETLLLDRPKLDALPGIAQPLLGWYDKHARTLPWRENPTPYRVWISEIMLQQTRVEAVKGYYARFMEALPDVPSLAGVEDDALLKLWEGLGYYSRARNLKRAAGVLVKEYEGKLPASYNQLLTLPGIGEYTAGAVASIAFGIPVPAVDGNVLRVMARLSACFADISLPPVKSAWRGVLSSIQPQDRPGDYNQALMELGATVCVPNGPPRCGECPVAGFCGAKEAGCAPELPVKAAKKQRRVEERTVVVVVSKGQTLLFQRDEKLLGGMYEPLNLAGVHLDKAQAAAALENRGLKPVRIIPLRPAKHIFTHIEWRMAGYLAYTAEPVSLQGGIWADKDSLAADIAIPSAFRGFTKELHLWLEDSEESE